MRMSQGVEWALHTCLNLAWSEDGRPVPGARLAELVDVPTASLVKYLQPLVRSGLLRSIPGPSGGFSLARPPADISFLDVVTAVEGAAPAFLCTEIRLRGPVPAPRSARRRACGIASVMQQADTAWRAVLARTSLADVSADVERTRPEARRAVSRWLGGTA